MKIYTVLCVLATFLLTPNVHVKAASTGQITITGSVPIACDLDVQQEAGATGIADISTGHANRHIATITESCNSPDGYTVNVIGANSGDHNGMFVDSVSADSHPFTISYGGVSVSPGGVVTDSSAAAFGVQKIVEINYSADDTLSGSIADTYEETLTFIMSAK